MIIIPEPENLSPRVPNINTIFNLFLKLPIGSLAGIYNKPKRTTYRSGDGYTIVVKDPKRSFTRSEHLELARFLDQELLHGEYDIKRLSWITIDDCGRDGADGRWAAAISKLSNNLDELVICGSITLNHTYLKTLDDLKETLAHEYGHHCSIVSCIRSHWSTFTENDRVANHRLPQDYYDVRGLTPCERYFPDYTGGWHLCDKEIIAEDYRVLFAPNPYNQNHGVIEILTDLESTEHNYIIENPSDLVGNFISTLLDV